MGRGKVVLGKGIASYFENQREFIEYVARPGLERQFSNEYLDKRIYEAPEVRQFRKFKKKIQMGYRRMFRRRPRRPLYIKRRRRRLTAKRAIVVTPARNVRSKKSSIMYGPRARLGERVGSTTAKSCTVITSTGVDLSSDTLHQSGNLMAIDQGTDLNQRMRRIINLRGVTVRFRAFFDWAKATTALNIDTPIYFHMAVVHSKHQQGTDPLSTTDFFRNLNSQRGQDFATSGGTIPPKDVVIFNTINADLYNIYFHKSYKITNLGRNPGAKALGPELLMKKYVKIKRQIRYEGTTGSTVQDNLKFIYWFTHKDSDITTNPATALTMNLQIIAHFREPGAE